MKKNEKLRLFLKGIFWRERLMFGFMHDVTSERASSDCKGFSRFQR